MTTLNAVIDRLDAFDMAIFISPNAAGRGLRAVRARRELPAGLKVVAIGQGTARELQQYGVAAVIVPPERFDSESVLSRRQVNHMNCGQLAAAAPSRSRWASSMRVSRSEWTSSAGSIPRHWARRFSL